MERDSHEWKRLMDAYTLEEELRNARYEGVKTLEERIKFRVSTLSTSSCPTISAECRAGGSSSAR